MAHVLYVRICTQLRAHQTMSAQNVATGMQIYKPVMHVYTSGVQDSMDQANAYARAHSYSVRTQLRALLHAGAHIPQVALVFYN